MCHILAILTYIGNIDVYMYEWKTHQCMPDIFGNQYQICKMKQSGSYISFSAVQLFTILVSAITENN